MNIPEGATQITFQPLGKHPAPYYYWSQVKGKKVVWYWSALGNGGTADSEYEAREKAKDWISGKSPKLPGLDE